MKTLLLFMALATGAAASEGPAQPEVARIEGVAPGPRPDAAAVPDLAREIAAGLRCPVCQGLSVADSDASAALNMYARIEELVAAGYSGEEIRAYFVGRYGEWVLLDPPPDGLNLVLWLGPGIAGGILIGWALSQLAQWRWEGREPATDPYEKQLLGDVEG